MKNNVRLAHHKESVPGSMGRCMKTAEQGGYNNTFIVKHGKLMSMDNCKKYEPAEVHINDFYIPGDKDYLFTSAVYLIEATDGTRGMLIDAYGSFFENNINRFVDKIPGLKK